MRGDVQRLNDGLSSAYSFPSTFAHFVSVNHAEKSVRRKRTLMLQPLFSRELSGRPAACEQDVDAHYPIRYCYEPIRLQYLHFPDNKLVVMSSTAIQEFHLQAVIVAYS